MAARRGADDRNRIGRARAGRAAGRARQRDLCAGSSIIGAALHTGARLGAAGAGSMSGFDPLCALPLQDGESVSAMTVWEAMGRNIIMLVTTQGRMYLIRIDPGNAMSFAGPLEFAPVPAAHLASK